MSDKYIAKKYITTASLTDQTIKCPNCYHPMLFAGTVMYCAGRDNPKCKLKGISYKEVKSLTTIERVEAE
jgi:hypothetical protein